jgi:hypothetical protein
MIVPGWVLILMGKPKIDKDTDKLVSAAGFWFQMSSLLMALYLLVPIDSSIVLYSLDNKLVVGIGLAGIPIITMLPAKLISLRWKA